MKIKKVLQIALIFIVTLGLLACGKEIDEIEEKTEGKMISSMIYSSKMDIDWNYSVYLPPSYEDSNKQYPVVYFLHGAYGTHKDYHSMFNLQERFEKLMDSGNSEEMILVFIDGFNSYYVDTDSVKMESAIIEDLMPFIDKEYRINQKETFITGLSMGGYGAARFALKYPNKFKASYLMSPGVWIEPSEDSSVRSRFHVYKDNESNFSIENWTKEHPVSVMSQDLDTLNMKIVLGTEDPIISKDSINEFVELLKKNNLEVELEMVQDASHNWDFWSSASEDALIYFSELIK